MRIVLLCILLFVAGALQAQQLAYTQIYSASYVQYKTNDLKGMRRTLKKRLKMILIFTTCVCVQAACIITKEGTRGLPCILKRR
ncbi:MAG: hypothetical protein M0D57_08950 [Sphingobacteriales bacterium JAD_PAG50586_3]|nr:MAG: hypothetical protein M0D57_08950 [Sphingobacteriales bacterium JAD_PAG50586_3]